MRCDHAEHAACDAAQGDMQDGVARMDIHGDDRLRPERHGEAAFHGHVGLVGRENEAHGSAVNSRGTVLLTTSPNRRKVVREYDEAGMDPMGSSLTSKMTRKAKSRAMMMAHNST